MRPDDLAWWVRAQPPPSPGTRGLMYVFIILLLAPILLPLILLLAYLAP